MEAQREAEEGGEAQELELVERVFLRLGVAESDEQLEKALNKFLPAVILKLTTKHQAVQDKVIELLTHISRRLKSRSSVQLPVDMLLLQFRDPSSSPHVMNFSLVYLRVGYPRLSSSEQARLLPSVLQATEGKSEQQTDSLLQMCVPALVHLSLRNDQKQRQSLSPLAEAPTVKTSLLNFLFCYLLLPYSAVDDTKPPPPGLSHTQVKRVTGGTFLEAEQLEKVKRAVLQFLSSDVFSAQEVIVHFIVAAGDPKHSVSDQADGDLKQLGSSVDWESPQVVTKLYSLYQGTVATPGKRAQPQSSSVKDPVAPANLRVRLRVFPYFLKSTYAANCFPACVQVVFDSLFGSVTNSKLRSQALLFVHHICERATDQRIAVIAPLLLTGLNKITDKPEEEPKLQALAYTGIGSIAKRAPALFIKASKQLTKLFATLQTDIDQEVRVAVRECLSMMSLAYKGVTGPSAVIVEALMLEHIASASLQARLMAVQYAVTVFPFSHIPSRFVCMIACGDSKSEVHDEGRRGLKPLQEKAGGSDRESPDPPSFSAMLQYFHKRANLSLQSVSSAQPTGWSNLVYSTAAGKLPFSPPVLLEALKFLRLCLESSAGVTKEQKQLKQTLPAIAEYFKEQQHSSPSASATNTAQSLSIYLELLKLALGPAADLELQTVAMESLLEAVAAAPLDVTVSLSADIKWIIGFTRSTRAEVREPASRLLGLVAGVLDDGSFLALVEQLLKDTESETYSVCHGAVVSLGYVVSNCLGYAGHRDGDVAMDSSSSDLIQRVLQRLVSLVALARTAHLTLSAIRALGEMCRSGPLPLPSSSSESNEGELSKRTILECMAAKLKSAKDVKLKECCALSLGYMAVGDPGFSDKQDILRALFAVKEEKAIELQFTVGEAISCVAAGSFSSVSRDPWKLVVGKQAGDTSTVGDSATMAWTLESILSEYVGSPLAIVRQSACIWLLAVLKHAAGHPDIQGFLQRIQVAFINMLTEKSDFTQEAASHGLGVVYELSDASQKEDLVKLLVVTIMEGRRSHKLTSDTAVFHEGELGKTPGSGGSLSTYKELCSLASDLNKPDLIYKFMHLANHHSLWNSRKGAAFGFSMISSQAQEQLAPYLPLIVPRLYRYKYDPSPSIQLAMSSIWSALVPETSKTIDSYLSEILEDLALNLNSNQWRSREASCIALSDLLQGRAIVDTVVEYLPRLWELCLRARDDIKESVRKAADIACKTLHKVTLRACGDATMERTGVKVIQFVLPLLLNKGMTNPSVDVRAVSLVTVLKISQNAGALLKPHISVLVPTLLESLSSLEPQALNTLSLRLSEESDVQEKLDDIRVASSKSSPMMEIVNLCIAQVDAEVLAALVPRLLEILKTGVGMGTKVSTAQTVVSLVHHSLQDLSPHAGKLLNALLSGLSDRSSAIRKAYAKAIGHLVKVTKDASIAKAIVKLKKWYVEKDDTNVKSAVALTLHAIAVHSPDTAKAMASEFVSLVFLAMHEQSKEDILSTNDSVKLWKAVWEELVPGMESGIRLYLQELVDGVSPSLSSPSWHIKAQGAAAMATIAEKMGSSLQPPHLTIILNSLVDGLQGRTWEGKESLLKALGTACVSSKAVILSPKYSVQPSIEKIIEVLLQQCKKRDLHYRTVAIEITGEVVDSLEVDWFGELFSTLLPIIQQSGESNGTDVGMDEEEKKANIQATLELREKAFLAVGRAWPKQEATQGQYYSQVCKILASTLPVNSWKVQVSVLSALHTVFDRLLTDIDAEDLELLNTFMLPSLCKCHGDTRYSAVRNRALETIDKVTSHLQGIGKLVGLSDSTLAIIRTCLATVTDPQQLELAQSVGKKLQQPAS